MALGGGTFLFHNKVLPGTYINFVSKDRAYAEVSDRGFGAMLLSFDWGPSGEVFRVDNDTFQKDCQKYFGYDYGHDKMKGLRDLFRGLKTGYFYRLNSDGAQATSTIGKAKYKGIRGNDLGVSVQADPDNTGKFIVTTYLTTGDVRKIVDTQKNLKDATELQDNDYIVFTKTGALTTTAYSALSGGTNGTTITVKNYQDGIDMLEPYYFNTLGYAGADDTIKNLLIAFTKRCREQSGAKFQLVIHGKTKVNYEGVISILNDVTDEGAEKGSLVYWTLGQEASCNINATVGNMIYEGEYTVNVKYKQFELEQAIKDGMFMFHNVTDSVGGNIQGDVRVLKDINTFTEFSKVKTATSLLTKSFVYWITGQLTALDCSIKHILINPLMTKLVVSPYGATLYILLSNTKRYVLSKTSMIRISQYLRKAITRKMYWLTYNYSLLWLWKNCT